VTLRVDSDLQHGRITAYVKCASNRKPKAVRIRLPHPQNAHAAGCEGGVYDAQTETVLVEPFKGEATVALTF